MFLLNNFVKLFSTLIIIIPLFLFLLRKDDNKLRKILLIVFIIYISAIFSIIISVNNTISMFGINYIPIVDILKNPMVAIVNIVVFIPFGCILPIIWKNNFKNTQNIIIASATFSLLVEILQLSKFGISADINALLANITGAIIGYQIFNNLLKDKCFISKVSEGSAINTFSNMWLIIIITFLIIFTIGSFLSDFIWQWLSFIILYS